MNFSEEKGFKKIYEGKAKILYLHGNDESRLVTYFKDDATAFNGQKKGTILKKGEFNNAISSSLFKLLKSNGIESHFIEKLSEREKKYKKSCALMQHFLIIEANK